MIVNYLMLLFFLSAVVMSGLETDRYEYSNLRCDSRNEGEKGPYNNPYKLRLCLHFVCSPPSLPLPANLCLATSDREECLRLCQTSMGTELVSPHAFLLRNAPRTLKGISLLPSLLRPRWKWIDTEGSAAGTRPLQAVCVCAVFLYMPHVDLVYQP
jgi:hypothetical protein